MTVTISNLRCFRGAFSLDIPALSIVPGSLVGLVGANGAGKSTLLDVIAGFIKPESGTVRVFGVDPTAQATIANLRQRIAWMTDDMPLFDLTLAQHINVLSGFYPTWDVALSERLISRFRLNPNARLKRLSKGEGTRARLVLSLSYRAELLLLDEPTTGLDPMQRQILLDELLEVVRDVRRSILLSSHSINDVERVCDRVLMLDRGRIVADGTPLQVSGERVTLEERLVEVAS